MSEFNFSEELKKMPDTPGVYLMHNKHDDVIYVGSCKFKTACQLIFQKEHKEESEDSIHGRKRGKI